MIPIKREYITHLIVGVESIQTTNIFHAKCFIILPMGVTYRSLLFYLSEWFTSSHSKPHSKTAKNTVVIVLPSISSEDTVHGTRDFKLISVKEGIGTHIPYGGTRYYYTKYGKPRYRLTPLQNMWHPYGKIFSNTHCFGVRYPLSLSNKNNHTKPKTMGVLFTIIYV